MYQYDLGGKLWQKEFARAHTNSAQAGSASAIATTRCIG